MEAANMKRISIIGATALFLLLGNTARSYAQQEEEPKTKPPKEEPKTKPAEKPQETKPEKQQEQPKTEKQQKTEEPQKQEEHAKPAHKEPPQRSAEAQKQQSSRPALRLSVRTTARIPDDRFHASFGQEHVFVISEPVMVGGYSRFQYSGFWFGFLDPWPVGWYYTDDVYVDYIDGGYYLYNPYYPGARVSISVVI
jgi:hypothetical protein